MADPIIRLFEEIFVSAEAVEEWVALENGETSILEYKLDPAVEKKHDPEGGKLPAKYSKEATAFANADGGVIVWGVEQKRGQKPVVVPLLAPKQFHDMLVQAETDLASPPIGGIKHHILMRSDNTGYVVTLIPRSTIGPHMAMARNNRYYVRAGESAVPMGHHQVRDAMFSVQTPHLKLIMWNYADRNNDPRLRGDNKFVFYIVNRSQVTARDLLIFCHASGEGEFYSASPDVVPRYADYRFGSKQIFRTLRPFNPNILHPGMEYELTYSFASPDSANPQFDELTFIILCEQFSVMYRLQLPLNLRVDTSPEWSQLIELPEIPINELSEYFQGGSVPPLVEITVSDRGLLIS